jgi:hypothetical protein
MHKQLMVDLSSPGGACFRVTICNNCGLYIQPMNTLAGKTMLDEAEKQMDAFKRGELINPFGIDLGKALSIDKTNNQGAK